MFRNFPPLFHATCFVVFFLCWILPAEAQKSYPSFSKFKGEWISKDGQNLEKWNLGRDRMFKGAGYRISDGDTTLTENLLIIFQDDILIYLALVLNQNEGEQVSFKECGKTKTNKIIFCNPNHDFPKRIEYRFKGVNKMYVKVSGDDGGFKTRFRKLIPDE